MAKLYELEIGSIRAFAVAETKEEMEERKAEVDAQFAFLPVVITEVELDGYTITATSNDEQPKNRGGRPRKEA